ncbi:MAG: hypothetical protein K2M13_05040 [Muribaculaceae bacterium]|nr:hypothetical protein [Muribaculaceae bacterium]
MLRISILLFGLGSLCFISSYFQSRQKWNTSLALILSLAEHRRDQLRPISVSPPLQPYSLAIELCPFLLRLYLINIDVQIGADQGAPLGEAVLLVRLRQCVRLYKFFITP